MYWPEDDQYYSGKIEPITNNGYHNVNYNDGDHECLNISNETWKFTAEEALQSANIKLANHNLTSFAKDLLHSYTQAIRNNSFMKHQAQGIPTFPLIDAYKSEEEAFIKTGENIHVADVPKTLLL